ncbi:alpha/beta hydrolase family protein [Desertimonas flava]|uniref:alpha/beta hydrolase family protein n=1 Tax=Desertimonas flava TaxID=2064846 RepID=UPI000E346D2E|nr:S9 family peptidase [Desertimonas flava]
MAKTPVEISDLDRFAEIPEVAISADGRLVAAVTATPDGITNRYRRDLVVVPATGDHSPVAVPPAEPGRTRTPRWSPVGTRLAMVVDSPNGGEVRVWDADDSSASAITVVAGWPDPIEELVWSPDGQRLLFVVREPVDRGFYEIPEDRRPPRRLTELGYREDGIGWLVDRPRQAYLVEPGAEPRKLSIGGFDDAEFSWHPDGTRVYFVSRRHEGRHRAPTNAVYTQAIDGGEPTAVTDAAVAYGQPLPSPSGNLIAVTVTDIAHYPATTHLAVLDPASGSVTDLSHVLDRDCHGETAVWRGDEAIDVIVDSEGFSGIVRFDVTAPGQYRDVLAVDQRRITAFDTVVGASGVTTAFVVSGVADPPALRVLTSDAEPAGIGAVDAVTPNAGLAESRDLRVPTHAAVATAPGVEIDSWLALPDGDRWAGPHPLVVWLQGGGTQFGGQWSHELQLLLSAGYAVVFLNPRGSAGYGTAWMRAVSGRRAEQPGSGWGVDDIADVAAVVRATLDRNPQLDAARVGVMGGSYGGLVTTHLLAQTDLFAAGWAERGPYNLYSDAGTMDESPWFFEAYLGGDHLTDPESYWLASPLRLVEGITAPLAIVHSEQDYRCPIGQAEELFMALKLRDRTVEMIRFPGEGHGLTRNGSPVHRAQRLELLLEWFGRWLSPVTSDAAAS